MRYPICIFKKPNYFWRCIERLRTAYIFVSKVFLDKIKIGKMIFPSQRHFNGDLTTGGPVTTEVTTLVLNFLSSLLKYDLNPSQHAVFLSLHLKQGRL